MFYFNPRSPWGERPEVVVKRVVQRGISIHAPRGGSDLVHCSIPSRAMYFNPRSPWGERLF